MKIIFSLFLFAVISHAEKARFDNYRVYEIQIENVEQLKALRQLADTSDSYNFAHYPNKVGSSVNLMVPPHQFAHFGDITKSLKLNHELKVKNLQEAFDQELPRQSSRAETMNWTEYHSVETIHAWLDSIHAEFPNITTLTSIGNSFEGRPLKLLKLSKKTGNRAIFVESHVHAREWIASATTTYIINELLRSSNSEVQDLANNIDWYFLVNTNPDGYEYTRNDNRNWRKTRSVQSSLCWGVDPNRNFGHNWMIPDEYGVTGSSTSPCSDVFSGPKPFSEPETAAIDKFLNEHPGIFDAYLDWNDDELMAVGTAAADRLFAKHGIRYRVGNQVLILYPASGNAQDHAFGRYNIPISFTYEMRGTGDYGNFGFFLPPEFIIPNAEEVLDSLVGLVEKAREFGRFINE